MNDKAFTFQTLHPDTIIDALFAQGIRVDSGLTPLNSYENRVYQFQDEDRRRMVVKTLRISATVCTVWFFCTASNIGAVI